MMNWFYPTPCLGCGLSKAGRELFCMTCGRYLEMVSPKGRCSACFEETDLDTCFACLEQGERWLLHRAYCIEEEGPWEHFIYSAPITTQAALLVYQYVQLAWRYPDVIYSTEPYFGREVAHFLKVPFRRRRSLKGMHVLVVERREKKDHAFLLQKGALSIDVMSLTTG